MRLYGQAFSADAGRCFRWIYRDDTSQPARCGGQVATRGWWRDRAGRWWVVDACAEHAAPLSPRRPGPGSRIGLLETARRPVGHPRRREGGQARAA